YRPMNPAKTVLILSLACAFASIGTRAGECLPVKVRNPEGNYIVPGVMGNIVYRRVDGRELALDAYVQKRGDARPAVIVVHGGGWDSGSRIAFVGQFLETITRAGYNWFSIDYRLGGVRNYKNALDDLRAATDFIRCHAKEFRINPENIALFGEDAGAHLAAMFAIEKPAGVKAAVLLGGFYDLREIPGLKSSSSPESLAQATPITQIVSGMPDVLIAHGAADTESRIDTTKRYCFEVTKAGGRCDFLSVEGGIHRPENWRPEQWTYKERMTKWLGRKLKLSA